MKYVYVTNDSVFDIHDADCREGRYPAVVTRSIHSSGNSITYQFENLYLTKSFNYILEVSHITFHSSLPDEKGHVTYKLLTVEEANDWLRVNGYQLPKNVKVL